MKTPEFILMFVLAVVILLFLSFTEKSMPKSTKIVDGIEYKIVVIENVKFVAYKCKNDFHLVPLR